MDSLLQAASAKDPAVFERIHGIGPKTAEKIVRQLNDQAVRNTIRRLAQAGLSMRAAPQGEKESPQVFAGEVWCVTGSFEHFTPRERAMEEVKKGGGRVVSSVTGATTHLLVGENPGSKLEKAKQLGITLVSEKAFLDRLKGS
jgi:DNA ligase (NAD+)